MPVSSRNYATIFNSKGVVVLAAAKIGAGKAVAELDAFYARYTEDRLGYGTVETVEHWPAQSDGQSFDSCMQDAANGIAVGLGRNNIADLLDAGRDRDSTTRKSLKAEPSGYAHRGRHAAGVRPSAGGYSTRLHPARIVRMAGAGHGLLVVAASRIGVADYRLDGSACRNAVRNAAFELRHIWLLAGS